MSTEDHYIDKAFKYHPPKDDQPERYVDLRDKAKEFAEMILQCCPASLERDRAIWKLEEAVMLANASIARNE